MKKESKQKAIYWGVSTQIKNRPTKNARGMSFTSERRARQEGKSIFYRAIISNQKTTDVARTLRVRGTTDTLSGINSVTKYNYKRYKKGLKIQRKGHDRVSNYLLELGNLMLW